MIKYLLISLLLIYNFHNSFAQKFNEIEMKKIAKEMVLIQVKTNSFKQLNSDAFNLSDQYDFNKYYLDVMSFNLNYSVNIDDVKRIYDFKQYDTKFKIFKVNFTSMSTWFNIAFGNDGSYYLLRNFEYNHINNLIRQKIGRPKTINEFIEIGKFYINTVQFSDLGFRKVINVSEYQNLKNKYNTITPPKLYKNKGDTIFEFCSFQKDTKKVKHHKLIFSDGLIKNVEETPDYR